MSHNVGYKEVILNKCREQNRLSPLPVFVFSLSHSPFSSFLLYFALLLVSFSLISNLFYIHSCPLSTGGHNDISICIAPCY